MPGAEHPNTGRGRDGDPGPRVAGLALAVLLPVFALATLATVALIRDWRTAQRDAVARAQEIATEIASRLDAAVGLPGAEASESPKSDDDVRFVVDAAHLLVEPPDAPWPPVPVPLPEFPDPGLRELWDRARAAVAEGRAEPAEKLWSQFLAKAAASAPTRPPTRLLALAIYERGLARERLQRREPAIEDFAGVLGATADATADLTESGLALGQLAALRILDLAEDRFEALPPRWRTNLPSVAEALGRTIPSPFLARIVTRIDGLLARGAFGTRAPGAADPLRALRHAERARSIHAAWTRALPAGTPWPRVHWVDDEAGSWLVVSRSGSVSDAESSRARREFSALDRARVKSTLEQALGSVDRRGEFVVRAALGGASLVAGPGRARVEFPRRELAVATRADSGLGWSVAAALDRPEEYFATQRRRIWMFGGLIALAAVASAVAVGATARALRQQHALNRAKSNFVSSVSHELRAPLGSIRLLAEGLERGSVPDESRRHEYFRLIGQETRRLGALVENVLDFSRIEQGRKQYDCEPVDFRALVSGTVRVFEPLATSREVRVSTELPEGEAVLEVVADGRALQQALLNLLDNALKHSKPGATIRVRLEHDPVPRRYALSVADDGPGIPAEDHARIFEPFYRRGSELRRETQGVGIGLSIVRHVMAGHDGEVRVDSIPGHGAVFTLVLPETPAANDHDHARHD